MGLSIRGQSLKSGRVGLSIRVPVGLESRTQSQSVALPFSIPSVLRDYPVANFLFSSPALSVASIFINIQKQFGLGSWIVMDTLSVSVCSPGVRILSLPNRGGSRRWIMTSSVHGWLQLDCCQREDRTANAPSPTARVSFIGHAPRTLHPFLHGVMSPDTAQPSDFFPCGIDSVDSSSK